MRLRSQLLFVSVLTLALPWAGCQYAREFETALRQSQQNALADSAGAIATVIAERPALLVRDPVQLVPGTTGAEDDIYARRLPSFVTLDGFAGDWDLEPGALLPLRGGVEAYYAAGLDETDLWLFVRVVDDDLVYERPGREQHDGLVIEYEDPAGTSQSLLVATSAVGRAAVRRRTSAGWVVEPAAQAVWEQNQDGYQVELRLRDQLVGARLGLTVNDARASGLARASSYSGERPGLILHRLPALERTLANFRYADRRIVVLDRRGWILAAVGDTRRAGGADGVSYPLAEKLIRGIVSPPRGTLELAEGRRGRLDTAEVRTALAGEARAQWYSTPDERAAIVVAAHPVAGADGVVGAVVLEQSSDAILTLTDRALTRLLTLTLGATLVAALALVGYATWLSLRIRRLSHAAEQAVGPEGDISTALPEQRAGDEIGDLSRSFAGLLARLREHTNYLRSLASKLSHELRTPLAVVQSSLDNLDAADLPEQAKIYSERAREGSARLRSILTAMSEASRVEQAIGQAEPERFDLREVLAGCVNGYRDIYAARNFELDLPDRAAVLTGSPELIAQMLDKLVDNAADFTADGGRISVALDDYSPASSHPARRERTRRGGEAISAALPRDPRAPRKWRLTVTNDGPPLPDAMQGRLFDSMVSLRSGKTDRPHLGFGLYIARLIAEAHGAVIEARNLPGDGGVEFAVFFPAAVPAA